MLNFNPFFKQADPEKDEYLVKTYSSKIVNIVYPEDILASVIVKESDVRTLLYIHNY